MIPYIDPIHGQIEYPEIIFQIVDTIEFQRLRNIKQLGVSSFVFCGGIHTRFEHCLGVCHLVDKFLTSLEKNSNVHINDYHRKCVMIAGLLHDVGHGPFSHMWESFVHRKKCKDWCHETTSCDITREIFKNYDIKLSTNLDEHSAGIELITALIAGNEKVLESYLSPDVRFLSEIVNNKLCSIDVDKWDYILRDAYYLNNAISISSGFQNAFLNARITKDNLGITHISYHYRHYPLLYDIFKNRSNLHLHCYQNVEIKGIEILFNDILESAEDAGFLFKGVKLSEAHKYPQIYKLLDDNIIDYIAISDDPILKTAQDLIYRLKRRQLYQIVHKTSDKLEFEKLCGKNGINKNYYGNCLNINVGHVGLVPESVILHNDNGEIVDRHHNWFDQYVIYSQNSPPLKNNVISS